MAIEIVDFPMKHGDFPWLLVGSPLFSPHPQHQTMATSAPAEVARVICKSLSHEELKWTRSAKGPDLTGVTITKSEVMQDTKKNRRRQVDEL